MPKERLRSTEMERNSVRLPPHETKRSDDRDPSDDDDDCEADDCDYDDHSREL